jgi:hypothetical protein
VEKVNAMPGPHIDPLTRIRVLAAALPSAVVLERHVEAPFGSVWRVVADLEQMAPRYESGLAAVRIVARQGVWYRLQVSSARGAEQAVQARMWPGWCLMQSATAIAAFAVQPLERGTLLAHLEHLRAPGPGTREALRARRAKLQDELETIARLATGHH